MRLNWDNPCSALGHNFLARLIRSVSTLFLILSWISCNQAFESHYSTAHLSRSVLIWWPMNRVWQLITLCSLIQLYLPSRMSLFWFSSYPVGLPLLSHLAAILIFPCLFSDLLLSILILSLVEPPLGSGLKYCLNADISWHTTFISLVQTSPLVSRFINRTANLNINLEV